MASKECSICQRKIGAFTSRIKLNTENIYVCKDCMSNAGYALNLKTITNISNSLTIKEISNKISKYNTSSSDGSMISKKERKKQSMQELELNADPRDLIKLSKEYVKNFNATFEIKDYLKYNKSTGEILLRSGILSSWTKTNLSNIKDYEVIQNGKNLQGFGIGRAAAGAILTGGIGVLVGFTKKKEVVTDLKLHLTLNSIEKPAFDFKLINTKTKTDSFIYKSTIKTLEELTNFFDVALSDSNQNTVKQDNTSSIAEEIKKFKELLDIGAITQEEFDTQKAKILR